jgi:hypothetical protein
MLSEALHEMRSMRPGFQTSLDIEQTVASKEMIWD